MTKTKISRVLQRQQAILESKIQISEISLSSSTRCIIHFFRKNLTDTGKNVQKWTRVFSTPRLVILVARTRRKKREEKSVSTFGRFRLWTSFESSPVSVKFVGRDLNYFLRFICVILIMMNLDARGLALTRIENEGPWKIRQKLRKLALARCI